MGIRINQSTFASTDCSGDPIETRVENQESQDCPESAAENAVETSLVESYTPNDSSGCTGGVCLNASTASSTSSPYECENSQPYTPANIACSQDPADPHWGRSSSDCAPLFDGDIEWSPNTARHIADNNNTNLTGYATLTFDATLITSVDVVQTGTPRHGHFELWARDLDGESATFGGKPARLASVLRCVSGRASVVLGRMGR